jgi:RHS repeat-associated protein
MITTFTLHYNSQWADPTRFLNGQVAGFTANLANYNRLVEKWVVRNGNSSEKIEGSSRDESLGIHGGEHFFKLPDASANGKVVTTPFTKVDWFATKQSGVYELAHTVALAKYENNYLYGAGTTVGEEILNINRSKAEFGNADFGAGWSLGGVQELLLTRNDGKTDLLYRQRGNSSINPINLVDNTASVAIVDGDGTTILYRPAMTIFDSSGQPKTLTYTSPVGDYSKFVKNLADSVDADGLAIEKGTYTRTLKDGTVYKFDIWGQLAEIKDLNGNKTTFTYDELYLKGHLKEITDPAGQKTKFTIDSNTGRVSEMITPGDHHTYFQYNNDTGNLIKITNPDGGNREWDYADKHHIKTFTDELDSTQKNTGEDFYDPYGRINGAKQRDGNVVNLKIAFDTLKVFEPTANINTIALGAPLQKAIAFTPDEFNAEIENAKHQKQTFTLNKNGQITKATDALISNPGETKSEYNLDKLLTKTTDKYGNVTSYTYDPHGNVTDIIYGDVTTVSQTTRIFGDTITTLPLDPTNSAYGGVGKSTQVVAYKSEEKSIAVLGTSKSWLQFVKYNKTDKSTQIDNPQRLDSFVENRYTSLQKLLINEDANGKPWVYVGYDFHSLDSFNPVFYLRDNRYSNVDPDAHGMVAKFALDSEGKFSLFSKAPLGDSLNAYRYGFSVGDIDVGAVNTGKDDVIAINTINNRNRLGLAQELNDGKLFHISPFNTPKGHSTEDTNAQPGTILVQGVDYFTPGYKIAILDDGTVAATVPGKNLIALFKKSALNPLILDWDESTPQLVTQGDVSALDTITIDGKKQLVYVSGNHLYRQAVTGDTTAKDLGIVGTSQAMAVGNLHRNLNNPTDPAQNLQDIVVADYNQNLHIFTLDALGNVKESQTSKINTKPRDITIFDWNQDGFNDVLIADGGSDLDIKLNQLKPAVPSTIPTELLDIKFEYKYATGTDRITEKTEIDTVSRGNSFEPKTTRKTVSKFNDKGNLTSIEVFGTSVESLVGNTTPTATTSTQYNDNGTIKYIEDAEHHFTKFTYYGASSDGNSQQVKTIERGGTSLYGTYATAESYTYYDTGYVQDVTDGNGNINRYEYDGMNRQKQVTKAANSVDPITSAPTPNITKTEYYKTGWVKSATDANGHTTSFEYDGVGRITKQTAADGGVTAYEYDSQIHTLKSITDPVLRKTSYSYYDNQQIKDVITDALADGSAGALSTTTHYEYNSTPTPGTPTNPTVPTNPKITTTVTADGQTSRTTVDEYDRYQRLIESKNPIGTITKNKYFDDGQIKSSTVTGIDSFDGLASHQTQFEYDGLGRQNKVVDALGETLGYNTLMKYDLVGNLTKMTDANGRVVDYEYDSLNRKTYSIAKGVTTYSFIPNTQTPGSTTADLITKYDYDKNSNLTSITDAQGRVVTNKYDELNRRTSSTVTNPLDSLDIPITTSRIKYDGVGNVLESTDANGHTTKYGYDELNRQNKVTDALGKVVSQKTYDQVGRIKISKNLSEETTTSEYDDVNHIMTMSTTNLAGISTQKTDAFGNIVFTQDAVGRTNAYEYDKLNRRTKSTDYRGREINNTYDGFNNLISTEDKAIDSTSSYQSNKTTYQYDELNRRIKTADILGQISRVEYDKVGNKTHEYLTIDPVISKIRQTDYQYDRLNRQVSMTTAVNAVGIDVFGASSPIASTTWMSYDNVGNIVGSKDGLNRITKSDYDKLNRQTAVIQAWGTEDITTSRYTYDKVGNRLEETNGRGNTTKYVYDELNRQIEIRDPYQIIDPNDLPTKTQYFDALTSGNNALSNGLAELGNVVSTSIIPLVVGKVVKTTDANNHATYVLYDKFDRQIATYDATKHQTSASQYDAVDRVIKSTNTFDTFGQTTNYTYNNASNNKVTVDSLNVTKTESFDAAGKLVTFSDTSEGNTRTTRYEYDKRHRQTKIIDANNLNPGETNYTYYNDGQTKSVTDAAQNITSYFYDDAGRLIREDSVNGSRKYAYDLVNNRIQGKDRNGRITTYAYDNLNRVNTEVWVNGGKTFAYTYDENGNRLTANDGIIEYRYQYDKTDLLTQTKRIEGTSPIVSFNYEYDNVGNLTQTDEIVGTGTPTTTAYEYNSRNLNTKITQDIPGLAKKKVKFTYDPAGSNTQIERYLDGLLKVSTTNAFDTHGRLVRIKQENIAGTVISNDIYGLDQLNRLKTETKQGIAPKSISYDNTDQVQTVTGSNSEAYTYDKNGNRTNSGYTTDPGNRLTSDGTYSYQYDPEGNRQSRTNIVTNAVDEYTWDYRNRLTGIVSKTSSTGTITQTVGYTYDVDDQRVSKTVTTGTGSTTEKYYLDGNQIAFVTDGSGNQTFHYLYGLNVDQVMAQDSPAGMVWALADRLGSIDTLTDGEGVVVDTRTYDSFGRVLSETNPSVSFRYGYTGRELDLESGLNYYRARYYDSNVGRFISVDPMGFGAGDTNLYRYVGNSSTNYTDPSGLFSLDDLGNYAYGGLENTDKFVAGFAHLVTGGYTTQLRNDVYGDRVEGQHEGFLFGAGQVAGFGVSLALGFATPNALVGVGAAGRIAQGYSLAQAGIGAYNTTTKIIDGKMDWSNPLSYLEVAGSFAPAIGFGAKQLSKIGMVENALNKATSAGNVLIDNIRQKLSKLNQDELSRFNRILEEGGIANNILPGNFNAEEIKELKRILKREGNSTVEFRSRAAELEGNHFDTVTKVVHVKGSKTSQPRGMFLEEIQHAIDEAVDPALNKSFNFGSQGSKQANTKLHVGTFERMSNNPSFEKFITDIEREALLEQAAKWRAE